MTPETLCDCYNHWFILELYYVLFCYRLKMLDVSWQSTICVSYPFGDYIGEVFILFLNIDIITTFDIDIFVYTFCKLFYVKLLGNIWFLLSWIDSVFCLFCTCTLCTHHPHIHLIGYPLTESFHSTVYSLQCTPCLMNVPHLTGLNYDKPLMILLCKVLPPL